MTRRKQERILQKLPVLLAPFPLSERTNWNKYIRIRRRLDNLPAPKKKKVCRDIETVLDQLEAMLAL